MHELIIIGSGMGSLSAAALLAKKGLKPFIIEQNWIPGGCTTSYNRKGFIFESGATTLVGMDNHMPLKYLLDTIGLSIPMRTLSLPMQVHLPNGQIINRNQRIEDWISEAKLHFKGDQEGFWKKAYRISQFVWEASTRYQTFPPAKSTDWIHLLKQARLRDISFARYSMIKTSEMMQKYQVDTPEFRKFVDEQLLISAQNHADEVNFLFGAAALCYTNYSNLYIDGGLSELAKPIVNYIENQDGQIHYRESVNRIIRRADYYEVITNKNHYYAKKVVAGIPLNNMTEIYPEIKSPQKRKIIPTEKLWSAFQMGIVFRTNKEFESIHHQIHLDHPLIQTGSKSIFLSLSHPNDELRNTESNIRVASISTHIAQPETTFIENKILENEIIQILEERGILNPSDIIYQHSSGPKSWNKWTGRQGGFVGGYPQFFHIKPWQMVESRLDGQGAYLCGDTTYPGQGIPGATLSGIIAAQKLLNDHY